MRCLSIHPVRHIYYQNGGDLKVLDLGEKQQIALQVLYITDQNRNIGKIFIILIKKQFNNNVLIDR